jgi:hypothetical protein
MQAAPVVPRREQCQSDGMSFFDSIPQPPPPPEPVRRPRPVWMHPDAVIPGSVPAELVLIRTEHVAVAVGSVRAYPNGFDFTLHVRVRGEDETEPGWHDPLDRHGRRGRQAPDDVLRLGLMYADGRRAATTSGYWPHDDETDPERLVLHPQGSGGNASRWDGDFWVHPLPPEGPVIFVAAWPKHGVAETRTELDSAVIREAGQRAVILWPEAEFDAGGGSSWRSGVSEHVSARAEPDEPGGEGAGTAP